MRNWKIKQTMKIIGKSNFDNESVNDILVCDNVNEFYGEEIVVFLNSAGDQNSTYYYLLAPDDYRLYSFES